MQKFQIMSHGTLIINLCAIICIMKQIWQFLQLHDELDNQEQQNVRYVKDIIYSNNFIIRIDDYGY